MKVFIGADHRGFNLKNKLISYMKANSIDVKDKGNIEYDPIDDFPPIAQRVARSVLVNPQTHRGIVICGSGVGVSIAVNRFRGIYCALAVSQDQVKSARQHDHINILALPADYITINEAQKYIDIFLSTESLVDEKYTRRLNQIEIDPSQDAKKNIDDLQPHKSIG